MKKDKDGFMYPTKKWLKRNSILSNILEKSLDMRLKEIKRAIKLLEGGRKA